MLVQVEAATKIQTWWKSVLVQASLGRLLCGRQVREAQLETPGSAIVFGRRFFLLHEEVMAAVIIQKAWRNFKLELEEVDIDAIQNVDEPHFLDFY